MPRPSLVRVVEQSAGTSNDPNPVGPTLTMAVDATGGNALIVHVAAGFNTANPGYQTTGVTYNGVAMTLIAQQRDTFYNSADVSAWYLANPPSGTHDVVASVSNGGNPSDCNIVAALVYSDVDTGDPYGAAFTEVTTTGGDSVAFVAVTDSGSNDIVVALMSTGTSINASDVGQTQAWINNGTNNSSGGNATGEYQDGASGTVDFGWNIGNDGWQAVAFTLHGSGGGSTVSGDGSAAGTSTAAGAGASKATSTGSIAGAASATGAGMALSRTSGSSAGSASAAGQGLAVSVAHGTAAGIGGAQGVGRSTARSTGHATGSSQVIGVSQSQRPGPEARVGIYLFKSVLNMPVSGDFVALPTEVRAQDGKAYVIVMGWFDGDTHDVIVDAHAQPASWHGTVSQVRQLLRENDLIPWWWLFDSFMVSHGAIDASNFREF